MKITNPCNFKVTLSVICNGDDYKILEERYFLEGGEIKNKIIGSIRSKLGLDYLFTPFWLVILYKRFTESYMARNYDMQNAENFARVCKDRSGVSCFVLQL